jgi:hypothetical protein
MEKLSASKLYSFIAGAVDLNLWSLKHLLAQLFSCDEARLIKLLLQVILFEVYLEMSCTVLNNLLLASAFFAFT